MDCLFVGQRIDHLIRIRSGLHEVDGISVDLPSNFDAEIAVSADIGGGIGCMDTVRIGFPGKFDFNVVTGDGGEGLAVAKSERSREMFGIDAHVEADAVTVGHDVVRTCSQQEQDGDSDGEEDFLQFLGFLSMVDSEECCPDEQEQHNQHEAEDEHDGEAEELIHSPLPVHVPFRRSDTRRENTRRATRRVHSSSRSAVPGSRRCSDAD